MDAREPSSTPARESDGADTRLSSVCGPDASAVVTARWLPWTMWALAAVLYLYGFFQRVAPSVMVDALMVDFAVGAALAGTLSSLYFYAYAGLQIPAGLLLDRWGPQRVLAAAAMVMALGSGIFALSHDLWMAYLGRLLVGAGAAFGWIGALKVISLWFPPERFALVTGLTLTAGMAGAIGGQAPLGLAVDTAGWRATMAIAGATALILAIALWTVLRDRPAGGERGGARQLAANLGLILRRRQTYLLTIYGACMAGPLLGFAGLWGVPYLMAAYDATRGEAALATSGMMVGWALGAPLSGWISDSIRRRRLPMIVSACAALAAFVAALYWPGLSLAGVGVFLCLTGLASGGMVLCFALGRELSPQQASGAVIGVVNTGVMASGALLQPLIGWLLDLQWDGAVSETGRVYAVDAYRASFASLIAALAAAALLAALARESRCRSVED